jgi:hypothetical protein
MSYEKIKTILIKDNKVFINGASNNIRPLDYHLWECNTLTNILQEQGKEVLDIEILKAYESGEFQGGNNKYTKALKVLYYLFNEEYKRFSWRNNGQEYEQAKELRKTQEFNDLLNKALNTKFPKEKYLITKEENNEKVYALKRTSRHLFWTYEKKKAKKFDFQKEAEEIINHFPYSTNWEIIKNV